MPSESSQTPSSLRSWVIEQYQSFNHDLAAGNLKDWVVCVGNEAGDLDTIASSIAFAYLSSSSSNHPAGSTDRKYIPVQQTKSTEFKLRPENLEVLKCTNLTNDTHTGPMAELICSDRVDFSKLTPYGVKYALLDHNQINKAIFGDSAEVVAVIDHHQAEAGNTLYPSADPRLIQVPTGSCASLVTTHFSSSHSSSMIPPCLADLLLSAIALDTHNFKRVALDDKTTDTDIAAKQLLLPRSQSSLTTASSLSPDLIFSKFYKRIRKLKGDVSGLNSNELLKRDYKQYEINGWSMGISSVPVCLETWVGQKFQEDWAKFLDEMKQYAEEKKLDMASVLTDHHKPKKSNSDHNQPKPGRRLVVLMTNPRLTPIPNSVMKGNPSIQSDDSLGFISRKIQNPASIDAWSRKHNVSVRVLLAQYPCVSRKQIAPALITSIEELGPKL